MGKREIKIKDRVTRSAIVMKVLPCLDIDTLLPPAGCNIRLYAAHWRIAGMHSMTKRTEERLELQDGPIVRLGRSSHRCAAMDQPRADVLDGASCMHRACGVGGQELG